MEVDLNFEPTVRMGWNLCGQNDWKSPACVPRKKTLINKIELQNIDLNLQYLRNGTYAWMNSSQ